VATPFQTGLSGRSDHQADTTRRVHDGPGVAFRTVSSDL
jgi:hypothetical protein